MPMREASRVFETLKAKGEEFFGAVSAELMSNPRFMKALETAWKGKAKLDETVAQALKTANIPTRTEFKAALRRLDALEARLEQLEAGAAPAARARAPRPRGSKPRAARPRTKPPASEPPAGE
jgi:polyhydroxyalkanoate synthesis regulator phasin